MMKRLHPFAAMLVLATPALAQSDAGRALASLSPDVLFVRATGPWVSGERNGTSRMVLLRTPSPDGAQRLYVQWLAIIDPSEARMGVITTEEIPEVFDWRVGIEDYRVEPEGAGSRVLIDGRVIGSGQMRRYLLTIGPPGEVTFGATR
jgi:hypothetical protein